MGDKERLPLLLAAAFLLALVFSYLNPQDRFTWWLEAIPAIVAAALLAQTYKRFRFSDLAYVLIFIHALILLIGAHYTYAEVPAFNWLRDALDLSRNHYDRVGHFAQGFVPAIVARELLLRTSPMQRGKWLFAVIVLSCVGISAIYELIEWGAAATTGEAADAFLGSQGDVWDTQKDMALALVGAIAALLLFSGTHDKSMRASVPGANGQGGSAEGAG